MVLQLICDDCDAVIYSGNDFGAIKKLIEGGECLSCGESLSSDDYEIEIERAE